MALSNRYPQPIAQSSPKSPVAEAFRTIRTNIQFAGVVQETKVILVTSSQPGEGKTSTVSNLAIVSAQAGNRVLLLDADMRKPQVHQRFQISNLDGLSNVLIKERALKDCISTSETPNLYLLPSGPIPPNPSEMLASKSFAALVERCREDFDMVFIDSPPILAVTDALILTRITDGTILVVDAQNTNRNSAIKAVSMLKQVNARILGTTLNRVPRKSEGSYYYYYSHGVQANA
ncbi:CpsD/CapB family tyrosine-protein kinase [Alicyclobacillus sp. SO9]|uniref:CpsD/CapB family tyrosine-protein kinase n=1 Tax=Alicyclobacillus sp. SO9 TaxID=2665646 RepID=UPI001E5C7D0F|nr:CpsD/CapB family tyrosine-protein kinase [Alicyclobacillus sp. SO9]